MEEVKQAFVKVKQDIFALGNELNSLKFEICDLKTEIKLISSFINDFKLQFLEKPRSEEKIQKKQDVLTPTDIPTHPEKSPTIQQINPTHQDIPADKLLSQVLKRQKIHTSIGNEGVPTVSQSVSQSDMRHIKKPQIPLKESKFDHLEKAAQILDSLDSLKKEIRRKIKALTSQEMSVFSLIYALDEQEQLVDYPLLSTKLMLSEGSIRDYIHKIIKKGIPILKEKFNNKRIVLHISPELKKIASLETISMLREI